MEMSSQPHTPAVLSPGKEFPLPMAGLVVVIVVVVVVVVVMIRTVQNFINSHCYLLAQEIKISIRTM